MSATQKGKLVVVGGHSRHVGKTSVLKAIQQALPAMAWEALKISNHAHHASTKAAELLELPDGELPRGAARLADLLDEGRNLLVESNRIVSWLVPDLVIFVIDPVNPDWKASSVACLGRADALVFSQDGPYPAPVLNLRKALPVFRMTRWNHAPSGFVEWLSERLPAAQVTSHESPIASSPGDDGFGRGAIGPAAQTYQMGRCTGARLDALPARSLELV